jgi:hypothetical protein
MARQRVPDNATISITENAELFYLMAGCLNAQTDMVGWILPRAPHLSLPDPGKQGYCFGDLEPSTARFS